RLEMGWTRLPLQIRVRKHRPVSPALNVGWLSCPLTPPRRSAVVGPFVGPTGEVELMGVLATEGRELQSGLSRCFSMGGGSRGHTPTQVPHRQSRPDVRWQAYFLRPSFVVPQWASDGLPSSHASPANSM